MTIPLFAELGTIPVAEMRALISDRLRYERKRMALTQADFAAFCGVSVRTYKRFELGKCDSLEVFLLVVLAFKRTASFDLAFPPSDVKVKIRSPVEALARLQEKYKGSSS